MPSKIYDYSKDELQNLINDSSSYSEVLIKIGLKAAGGNIATIRRIVEQEYKLDISLMFAKREALKLSKLSGGTMKTVPKEDLLIQNCKYKRVTLRRFLIRNDILEYKCNICGLGVLWQGIPIRLNLED
jgi:hypothetical protein